MSERDVITSVLEILGKSDKVDAVLDSPQTEFEDGKLVSLDLSDIGLTSLPKEALDQIPTLKRLHASFNDISDLVEDTFNGLDGLEFLNLYGNNLTRLPENIFEGLEDIEWLDLRSNSLEAVPKSVGYLVGLKYLFLQKNPLSDHPDHNWAADYHSARDIKKFLPEFQESMGLEVTVEKALTRKQIAERELKKRQAKEKEKEKEE